jgi:hypothetical protein
MISHFINFTDNFIISIQRRDYIKAVYMWEIPPSYIPSPKGEGMGAVKKLLF